MRTRPNSQLVRTWSANKLELRSGRRVLDLGCGTGSDLIEVVSAVGREGRAVGIDVSATLLALARERTAAVPAVALVRADAERLPQRSGAYDACRVERVLLHVGDPSAVLAEIFRVLAPNGRVTIVEPDFAAWFADSPDPELDALVVATINQQQHPNAGRTLARLLRVHGFIDVEITGHLAVYDGVPGGWSSLGSSTASWPTGRSTSRASSAISMLLSSPASKAPSSPPYRRCGPSDESRTRR